MRRTPHFLTRGLWVAVGLLVMIGVAAAVGRGIFLGDFASRGEPFRQQILHALGREDRLAAQRADELAVVDGRFGAHPVATLLHILPGAVFLILAPLQFSSRVRNRHIRFHRWSGRMLVFIGFVAVLSGLFFGLLMPYGGMGEAIIIALAGGLFMAAAVKAILAIRKHQVARHREWMIRAFAVAVAISTVRIVAAILDLTLTPAGYLPSTMFVLSLWLGWGITVGAAELWIRYTRPRAQLVVPVSPRGS